METAVTDLLVLLGSQLLVAVATIAVMKTEIRWIKDWCKTHEAADEQRFKDLAFEDRRISESDRDERDDMRDSIGSISNRLSRLEGSQR